MQKQLVRVSFLLLSLVLLWPNLGYSFCGFYVARADAKLYNSASQVVVARDEDKTVITMVNNFKGDLKEFAMVIPVPTVLEKEMVRVIEPKVVEHLDAYSAPRLVEYHDPDPCMVVMMEKEGRMMAQQQLLRRWREQDVNKPLSWVSESKPSILSVNTTLSCFQPKNHRDWRHG